MATMGSPRRGLDLFRLNGRVALITGGSRGLGEAMGAAHTLPNPAFSTCTAIAIFGLSRGAKAMKSA